ncbi:MAG TPA: hydroxymethylbilane synthase [Alphaproteobacteria bacterium]|nr:hydroxymethylbilane synthase [Alphaproteobacteria bacterium]
MQSAPFLRIGTRGSPLALAQAHLVRRLLAQAHGVAEEEIAVEAMTTSGDRLTEAPLAAFGGKGLFSKELEVALAAGVIDIAVHSSKDLATRLPDGLFLPAFLAREDVRDAFVSLSAETLEDLPRGARVGSSSIRRAAQIRRQRPDLTVVPFRGNVDTRLNKLRDGVADATLLAVAGLNRLGRQNEIRSVLDPRVFPPAPAQGAIGIEARVGDARTVALVAPLNHAATMTAVTAERAMLAELDGSCRTAIGVFTEREGDTLTLHGEVLAPDGSRFVADRISGAAGEAAMVGAELGRRLRAAGGPLLLAQQAG